MAFVETRLRDVENEMRSLASTTDPMSAWSTCDDAMRNAITRASISSTLVRRFVLSEDGLAGACRPEGRGAAPFFPYEPTVRLAVTSTGEISRQLTATLRRGTSGRVVSAVLDPRVFEPAQGEPASWVNDRDTRLILRSADGRRLSALGMSAGMDWTTHALDVMLSSSTRDVQVLGSVDRNRFAARITRSVGWTVLVTALLMCVVIALFWRRVMHRARLFHRIQRGLRKREFEPYVQPILDLRTGRCAGAEILMRWQHPHRGTLPPAEFIEEAERTGLIAGMSELVMNRTAHRLAPLAREYPDIYFRFNLTPQQLAQPELVSRLGAIFRDDTLRHARVLLEITEREFVDPAAAHSLRMLHDTGWRVAVDDFGTGHSSLAALERLAIDRLKIDRAFVSTISEETVNRPVLDSIIDLADRLSLPIIAEGIETKAQLDYLAARGVQYGQGYLIGRLMQITAFKEWLGRHNTGTPPAVAALGSLRVGDAIPPDRMAQRLWNAMRVPGGLDVRDRMFHLRTYSQCFVGREAVDWMVQHYRISRADAVLQGQRLLALGLVTHVLDEHDFEDAELFYRLASPTDASQAVTPAPIDLRQSLLASDGLQTRSHTRGLVRHGSCVTGASIVDWIVTAHQVPRATARQWALQLMREGVLRHVYDDRPFTDGRTLFRLV